MKRPTGVTILAALDFLAAGTGLVGVVATCLRWRWLPSLWFQLFVLCVLPAIIGVGLWKLRNLARYFTFVLPAPNWFVAQLHLRSIVIRLVQLGVWAWVIWYLFRPRVREAFGIAQGTDKQE